MSHLDFESTQDLPFETEFDFPGWQHFYKYIGCWFTESWIICNIVTTGIWPDFCLYKVGITISNREKKRFRLQFCSVKAGLFSDAVPVEGNSIIPASIQLNVPFLNQHRDLQVHFWVPWVTMPYFSQPEEEGDYCLPRKNLHECVLGGDGQWAHHVPTISDRCSGSAQGEEKKKKNVSGEKREPTEGSLILLIVHSTSLITWDCAAKRAYAVADSMAFSWGRLLCTCSAFPFVMCCGAGLCTSVGTVHAWFRREISLRFY